MSTATPAEAAGDAPPAPPVGAAADAPLDPKDVATCIRVLEAVLARGPVFYAAKPQRLLRKALAPLLQLQQKKSYLGGSREAYVAKAERRKEKIRRRQREKAHDAHFANTTALRAGRLARLAALRLQESASRAEPHKMLADGEAGAEAGGGSGAAAAPDAALALLFPDGAGSSLAVHAGDPAAGGGGNRGAAAAAEALRAAASREDHARRFGNQQGRTNFGSEDCDAPRASKGGSSGGRDKKKKGAAPPPQGSSKKQKKGPAEPAHGAAAGGARASPAAISADGDCAVGQKRKKAGGGGGGEGGGTRDEDADMAEAAGTPEEEPREQKPDAARKVHKPRSCYVCRRRFTELHFFYDRLCPDCAAHNYEKRNQTADLRGRVAVLTGGRVKIGFHVGLKLLRAGARCVVTTRFPRDCVRRYAAEPDFGEWAANLQVVGLDLRDVAGVHAFADAVSKQYGSVDVVINNACQTVRRPVAYYRPLVEREQQLLDDWAPPAARAAGGVAAAAGAGDDAGAALRRACLGFHCGLEGARAALGDATATAPETAARNAADPTAAFRATVSLVPPEGGGAAAANGASAAAAAVAAAVGGGASRLPTSALLSQVPLLPEDAADRAAARELVAAGARDINGNPVDLRKTNSWRLPIEQVSTPEVVECMFVNAVAPFVLNSRLHACMASGPARDRYVINVSAQEGKFYRYKTPNHPHTNMAKAALNMMVRTSAEAWSRERIFLNAVDTGWINDENPAAMAARNARENDFQTPIDEIDAAARILDPVLTGVATGVNVHGMFFKDYRASEW